MSLMPGPKSALRLRRHLREAVRGYYRRKRNHRVVTEVKQKTGDNRTCKSSRKSENDSDGNQHRHKSPRPAELSAVHQSEQRSRQDNAETGTGANGICGFSSKKTRNPEISRDRKSTRLNSSHVRISYAVF